MIVTAILVVIGAALIGIVLGGERQPAAVRTKVLPAREPRPARSFAFRFGRKPTQAPEHGSAEWADPSEVVVAGLDSAAASVADVAAPVESEPVPSPAASPEPPRTSLIPEWVRGSAVRVAEALPSPQIAVQPRFTVLTGGAMAETAIEAEEDLVLGRVDVVPAPPYTVAVEAHVEPEIAEPPTSETIGETVSYVESERAEPVAEIPQTENEAYVVHNAPAATEAVVAAATSSNALDYLPHPDDAVMDNVAAVSAPAEPAAPTLAWPQYVDPDAADLAPAERVALVRTLTRAAGATTILRMVLNEETDASVRAAALGVIRSGGPANAGLTREVLIATHATDASERGWAFGALNAIAGVGEVERLLGDADVLVGNAALRMLYGALGADNTQLLVDHYVTDPARRESMLGALRSA
jgi:hypothetical protein